MQKVVMWLSILAVVALVVLNLVYDDRIPYDEVYPMANQRITWETEMPVPKGEHGI